MRVKTKAAAKIFAGKAKANFLKLKTVLKGKNAGEQVKKALLSANLAINKSGKRIHKTKVQKNIVKGPLRNKMAK